MIEATDRARFLRTTDALELLLGATGGHDGQAAGEQVDYGRSRP